MLTADSRPRVASRSFLDALKRRMISWPKKVWRICNWSSGAAVKQCGVIATEYHRVRFQKHSKCSKSLKSKSHHLWLLQATTGWP